MHPVEGVCFAAVSVHPPRGAQISFQLQGPPHCNSASAYKQSGLGYPPKWAGLASFLTQGQTAPADSGVAMGHRTKEMRDCETTVHRALQKHTHPADPHTPPLKTLTTHPYTPLNPYRPSYRASGSAEAPRKQNTHAITQPGPGPCCPQPLVTCSMTPQPLEVQEDLTHTVPHSPRALFWCVLLSPRQHQLHLGSRAHPSLSPAEGLGAAGGGVGSAERPTIRAPSRDQGRFGSCPGQAPVWEVGGGSTRAQMGSATN